MFDEISGNFNILRKFVNHPRKGLKNTANFDEILGKYVGILKTFPRNFRKFLCEF